MDLIHPTSLEFQEIPLVHSILVVLGCPEILVYLLDLAILEVLAIL